jgi:hypothetical protein
MIAIQPGSGCGAGERGGGGDDDSGVSVSTASESENDVCATRAWRAAHFEGPFFISFVCSILLFAHLFFCCVSLLVYFVGVRWLAHAIALEHDERGADGGGGGGGGDRGAARRAALVGVARGDADGTFDQVSSVLLCTVTFYANRAHNLTRSPSHL